MRAVLALLDIFLVSLALLAVVQVLPAHALTQVAGTFRPGQIDRIGRNEMVINDSLYQISPDVAFDLGHFTVGQTIEYRTDEIRNIVEIRPAEDEKLRSAWADDGVAPRRHQAVKPQKLRQVQGIWQN